LNVALSTYIRSSDADAFHILLPETDPSHKVAGYDSYHCHRRKDRRSVCHCCHRRPSHCAVWPCRKIWRSCTNSLHAASRHRRLLRHAPVFVLKTTLRPPSWPVAQTVPSLYHSHQGALGCCCWTWSCCFGVTFLTEHSTLMMIKFIDHRLEAYREHYSPSHQGNNLIQPSSQYYCYHCLDGAEPCLKEINVSRVRSFPVK